MIARLYCKTGPLAGTNYQIDEEATIGRGEENDVTLPHDAVSKRHARIFFDDEAGCYMLEDLDSSNGTRLDDTMVVNPIPLEDLHIITFAQKIDFIFQAVEKEPAAPAEEGAKTQIGQTPAPPSDLSEKDDPAGERTQVGRAPGGMPDLPEADSSAETEEKEPAEDEDHTRFGEAPPELPDFSEEDASDAERTRVGDAPGELPDLPDEDASETEDEASEGDDRTRMGDSPPEVPDLSDEDESEAERTRMRDTPGGLPDLPEEESTPDAGEEETSEAEDRTQFGDSPPEVPDLSDEDESEAERTRVGDAPGGLPDLPDEDASDSDEEDSAEESEAQTQFGGASPDLPDLPGEPSEDASDEADDRTQMGADAPSLPDLSESEEQQATDKGASPAEPSPQYALQVVLEGTPQETHPLPEGEVTIGRSSDCDIQIEDPGVSREHARLLVEPDKIVVEDMGSKNFTFIDGERLSGPTAISPSSEIQFGLQVKAVVKRASS